MARVAELRTKLGAGQKRAEPKKAAEPAKAHVMADEVWKAEKRKE